MTIYRAGTDAKGSDVAVKEVQFYGDFQGPFSVAATNVTIHSDGPYIHSDVIQANYRGMALVGRAVVQPAIWAIAGVPIGRAAIARP
jgi:hypothetical protein